MESEITIERALERLPDIPRWVEARAVLLSGTCSVFGTERGFLVRNDAPGGQLIVAVGEPQVPALDQATAGRPRTEFLCAPESASLLGGMLDGWARERALLFRLEEPESLAPEAPNVRVLEAADSLEHVPSDLREELRGVDDSIRVWAAFEDSRAASFAYAYWRTAGQFDLSIDTAPEYRRRGLARVAVSECIRQESAGGRTPVWGAMESNVGSQRLAQSLGFCGARSRRAVHARLVRSVGAFREAQPTADSESATPRVRRCHCAPRTPGTRRPDPRVPLGFCSC